MSIAESLDSYAAWQPAFDGCSDKMRGQESKRDRHIDLTRTAFLTCCDLLNVGDGARHDLVKPATTSGDCADKPCASLDPCRTNFILSNTVRDKDLSGLPGRRL